MNEETLIYYRQAQDSVKNLATLIDESVTKELIVSCRQPAADTKTIMTGERTEGRVSAKVK